MPGGLKRALRAIGQNDKVTRFELYADLKRHARQPQRLVELHFLVAGIELISSPRRCVPSTLWCSPTLGETHDDQEDRKVCKCVHDHWHQQTFAEEPYTTKRQAVNRGESHAGQSVYCQKG